MEREEILFWKVFKNKFLLKEIFKKRTFRLGCYSYYECNNVDWMINNGYLDLLYFKINSDDKDLIIEKKTIFKYFKSTSTTTIFSKLFKNYPNLVNFVPEIIENDNLQAFQVIVDEHNYIPTESNLLQSIKCGSFLISNFIISKGYVGEITNELKDRIWENSIGYQALVLEKSSYSKIDNELHYRKCKYFIDSFIGNDQYKTLPKPIEIDLKYVAPDKHKVFGGGITNIKSTLKKYDNFKYLFKMFIYEKSLEFILNCCSIISTILKLQSDQQQQQQQEQERPSFILTNEEINEMKFTSKELSTNIGESDSNDDRIKKLFIMVLYFTNDFPLGENYNFLGMKYFKELDSYSKLFNPIEFGTYDGESIFKRAIQYPFKYCKNDRNGESIIEYIKKAVDDINDSSIDNNKKFSINKLFETCFIHDDLNLFELVYNNLTNNNNNNVSFSIDTFTKIKSIKMFDFIFNKIKTDERKIESFKYLTKNYQLANHFKENYSNYYYQALGTFSKQSLSMNYEESSRFMIENWEDFNIDPIENWRHLLFHFCVKNPTKIQELNKIDEITIPYYMFSTGNESILKQLNYMLTFRYNEFINSTIKNVSSQDMFMVSYLRGQLKEFLENGLININDEIDRFHPTSVLHSLSIEISQRNDYKTLEFLLSYYSNNSKLVTYFKSSRILSKLIEKLNNI
ncbi:hypothetical protein ACTFIU_009094 [Dictyostelium citrinum]